MTLNFEVFKKKEDYYSWDKYIEFASKYNRLPKKERDEWVRAKIVLKSELGNSFLHNSFRTNHPIVNYLTNRTDLSISWIINFSQKLELLKEKSINYSTVVKKLLPFNSAIKEGIPFIEIGSSLSVQNLKVEFEPSILSLKKPDIKFIDFETNTIFFVEVSKIEISPNRENNINAYHSIHNLLTSQSAIPFSGKILMEIDKNTLKKILHEIKAVKNEVKSECKFSVYENKFIEIGFSTNDCENELEVWRIGKGYRQYELDSLPIDLNENFQRIRKHKIEREAKQIPDRFPGIIYFPLEALNMLFGDLDWVVLEFRKKLKKYPNILGVVLYSKFSFYNIQSEFQEMNEFIYSINSDDYKMLCKQVLLVKNPSFNFEIPEITLRKIYNSLSLI